MAEEGFRSNKINRRVVETARLILALPESIDPLIDKGDQESVNLLTDKINEIEEQWMAVKKSLVSLIKAMVDPDAIEEDVEETEKGKKY